MDKKHKKTKWRIRGLVACICLAALLVSLLIAQNTALMRSLLTQKTEGYLEDVSSQVLTQIDARLLDSVNTLKLIGDSAVLLEPERLDEFFARKGALSEFDQLYLISTPSNSALDPSLLPEGLRDSTHQLFSLEQLNATLLLFPEENTMAYLVPAGSDGSQSVLGIKSRLALQKLVSAPLFDGQGVSFVITRDGTPVAAPENTEIFQQLDTIFLAAEDPAFQAQVDEMTRHIRQGESGSISFTSLDGREVLMTYQPLTSASWCLLTMVPADILRSGVDSLSRQNQIITVTIILFVLAIILTILYLQRRHQTALEQLAFQDPITGGMNGTSFLLAAAPLLRSTPQAYALISMDVQSFKLINSVYGTQAGDKTLKYLYDTLRQNLMPGELLARSSGDLFYLLLHTQDRSAIVQRLEQIYQDANHFNLDGDKTPYYLELRFGIYLPEQGDLNVAELQERANSARKSQNSDLKYRYIFYNEMRQKAREQEKEFVNLLESSLKNGDFLIHLQPKVRLRDLKILGAEALIRWQHPEKGLISPALFVPVFEKYGLIHQLDRFVFEEVCKLLSRWMKEGKELLSISVNLSRQNLNTPGFLQEFKDIYAQYDLPNGLVEFELTETAFLEEPEAAKLIIDEMHAAGFLCSLDDFGTGYSSLSLLGDLNVDTIKLDRSFFIGKNTNQRGQYIVEAIMKLAGQLHISTVAEGIDNMEQVRFLNQSACTMIQGFIFSRPAPPREFELFAYVGTHLRALDTYAQLSAAGPDPDAPGQGAAPKPALGSIISFAYHPRTDEVIFSSPFSPVLEGQCSIQGGHDLFAASSLIHENDRESFLQMLAQCQLQDGWVEDTLRFYAFKGRYEWLDVYIRLEEHSTPDAPVISGIFVNTEEWKAELFHWKEKANRDALTGLYNREALEEQVNAVLAHKKRAESAMIFIDLDDFKRINDTLGHLCGDDILRYVARRLLKVFRQSDVVARYGGDEFVVFAPGMNRTVLLSKLELLQQVFQEEYQNGSIRYKISGSFGAACYPQDGANFESLIACADSALYQAKRSGKNRYALYAKDLPAAPEK